MLAQQAILVDPSYKELGQANPPSVGPIAVLGRPVAALLRRLDRKEGAAQAEEIMGELAGSIGWLLNMSFGYGGEKISYHGDPSVASAEVGEAFREVLAADCLAIVEEVVQGVRRAEDVRSIASDPIVIHPLFRRRLALATTLVGAGLLFLAHALHHKRPAA